jgi:Sel1 repeat
MVRNICFILMLLNLSACVTHRHTFRKPPAILYSQEYNMNRTKILGKVREDLPKFMESIVAKGSNYTLDTGSETSSGTGVPILFTTIFIDNFELSNPKLTACEASYSGKNPALQNGRIIIEISSKKYPKKGDKTNVKVETKFRNLEHVHGKYAVGSSEGTIVGSKGSYPINLTTYENVSGFVSNDCYSTGYIEQGILDFIEPNNPNRSLDSLTFIPASNELFPVDEKELTNLAQKHSSKDLRKTTIAEVEHLLAEQHAGHQVGSQILSFSLHYNNLGVVYTSGEKFPRDLVTAFKMFELAANYEPESGTIGYHTANYNLGVMYAKGLGVTRNRDKAYELFDHASFTGLVPQAKKALGLLHPLKSL